MLAGILVATLLTFNYINGAYYYSNYENKIDKAYDFTATSILLLVGQTGVNLDVLNFKQS
jgi:hypothetical protein